MERSSGEHKLFEPPEEPIVVGVSSHFCAGVWRYLCQLHSHGRWLYQLPCKQQKKNKREFRDWTQWQRIGHCFFKSNFDLEPVLTDPPSTVAASAAQAAASAATQLAESAAPPSFLFSFGF